MFFISRRRKLCPDTADNTGRYNNSNLLPKAPTSPFCTLAICNMSIFFVGQSFITICIMLIVSLESHFVICNALKIVLSLPNTAMLSGRFDIVISTSLQLRHSLASPMAKYRNQSERGLCVV